MPGANFQALLVGTTSSVKSVSYRTQASQGSGSSSYNFTNQDIGTAASDRYVIVAIGNGFTGGPRTVSAVTVGGISATQVVSVSGSTTNACLWIAAVPTGTTATIAITLSGTVGQGIGIAVWAAYGLSSGTASASGSSTASPGSITLNPTTSDGFVIVYRATGGSVTTMTPTNYTERFDGAALGSDKHQGGDGPTTGVSLNVQCATDSGGDTNRAMVAACW